MRVLVAGAAGSIGTVVCSGLVDRGHDVAGLDVAAEPAGFTGAWFTADCSDPDAVDSVLGTLEVGGAVDAVVHLANIPDEASLDQILDSHVLTTATLLDAMLGHGVSRIVYASSNHAIGRTPRPHDLPGSTAPTILGVDVPPRPDTFYGVGKVAAEALLRLYADRHGMDALIMRIGSFLPHPESRRHLSTWLSPDDAVRMVDACLTAPDPGYAVLYGISANTRAWWDLEPGRHLGYVPQDDAEEFAHRVEAEVAGSQDDAESAYVGGPFVSERLHRPARWRA